MLTSLAPSLRSSLHECRSLGFAYLIPTVSADVGGHWGGLTLTNQNGRACQTVERRRKFFCDHLTNFCGVGYRFSVGLERSFTCLHDRGHSFRSEERRVGKECRLGWCAQH